MTTRYALVRTNRGGDEVKPYLPGNYQVIGSQPVPPTGGWNVYVAGEDNAGWTLDDYVIPRLGSGLISAREVTAAEVREAIPVLFDKARDARLDETAREITASIIESARTSGDDPIAWVTGNSYMPPLRSFAAAEQVWQDDEDGEDFAYLTERVEARLADAQVALECPDYDNALYAVDLKRFEYVEDPGDHETLQEDWKPRPQHADYPHEPGRLHDCPACEDHCHCTPGYTECVFEGDHNGLADAPPGTPCEKCGCAS